jgi:uncharacterized protein YyaL (SSP411 family)
MANRLAFESSPYLQQHRDNPVDWFPWGDEALAKARREDKPILLSVGYSACHWCHVMEHESFADAQTAALMNDLFVSIKVDREERPDVDALYMQAVQQMTGHGGWPMTVFLTPEGTPFYGGTYFPPQPRHGLPSFRQILQGVHTAYRERRAEVEQSAANLRQTLAQGMAVNPEPTGLDEGILPRAYHGIASRFDSALGGFGGAPKFPQPMVLDFLLRYSARTGSADAIARVEKTLDSMARGGIHDQIGGGFHRYSVDARWLVPHFEKMLYDNALLSRIYARAYQSTRRPDFRRVAEDTLDFLLREMRHPAGGFFSSLDADSEGEEGRFYVWTADEIDAALGTQDGPRFRRYFDVSEVGNWEGKNILHCRDPVEEVAAWSGDSPEAFRSVIDRSRQRLYELRSRRIWPARDEKVLTSWNAMTLHAFAEAGRVLDDARYVRTAIENAEFLLSELRPADRLLRSWRDGAARIDGFLEDHALLSDALIELYRATFDLRWIREARSVADRMIDNFWSPDEELFFDTAARTGGLFIRPRDLYDNATPSGTSAAAQALTRLARLTGDPAYERIASRVVRGLADVASRVPQGFAHLLGALTNQLASPTEVAIVGDPEQPDTRALLDLLNRRFLPETTVALRRPGGTEEQIADLVPLLAHRETIDGKATAFVCQHYTCRLPVTSPADLEAELDWIGETG